MRSPTTRAGARILGVSPDDSRSHAKFVKKPELPFTLLADTEKSACEAYGVWKEKNMYGKKYMGVERTTFVIDAKGIVRQVFPRVKVEGHADAVLEAIKTCRDVHGQAAGPAEEADRSGNLAWERSVTARVRFPALRTGSAGGARAFARLCTSHR